MDFVRDKVLRRAQMLIELVQLKCATRNNAVGARRNRSPIKGGTMTS